MRRSSSSIEGSAAGCREVRRASLRSVVSSSSIKGGEADFRGRFLGGESMVDVKGGAGGRRLTAGGGVEMREDPLMRLCSSVQSAKSRAAWHAGIAAMFLWPGPTHTEQYMRAPEAPTAAP